LVIDSRPANCELGLVESLGELLGVLVNELIEFVEVVQGGLGSRLIWEVAREVDRTGKRT
jgi:hypothetical protein